MPLRFALLLCFPMPCCLQTICMQAMHPCRWVHAHALVVRLLSADWALNPNCLHTHMKAYEDMPIEEFGKAMLRGMGWAEGMGVGRNRKQVRRRGAAITPPWQRVTSTAHHEASCDCLQQCWFEPCGNLTISNGNGAGMGPSPLHTCITQ